MCVRERKRERKTKKMGERDRKCMRQSDKVMHTEVGWKRGKRVCDRVYREKSE